MTAAGVQRRLRRLANPAHAAVAQRYFKTGAGEYGEGDRFHGVRVPILRALVREVWTMDRVEVKTLLRSPWHEERLTAALILVRQYARGSDTDRAAIVRLYLSSIKYINNWDLVDSSAPHIVGAYLDGHGRRTLLRLARSAHLWSRRVAILATLHTIKQNRCGDTLVIAKLFLTDPEDLIHKATGWMLREVGRRDREALEAFLDAHAGQMPRTMLRYAIEQMTPARRRYYLGNVGRAR